MGVSSIWRICYNCVFCKRENSKTSNTGICRRNGMPVNLYGCECSKFKNFGRSDQKNKSKIRADDSLWDMFKKIFGKKRI